ncbi:proline dehydrogenase 1, mitochondrial-like [Oratosquilla oratoria]|uniref:proline dehydrogenase 1, mitochondrial-like n=1 Tax=Oratosquilla oratoria TaxID=337810 RepID=UPI003F7773AE
MKNTFYGHFVAGEDQTRIQPTLECLRSFGVKSILDYSVEEDISSETAEAREMELHRSDLRSYPKCEVVSYKVGLPSHQDAAEQPQDAPSASLAASAATAAATAESR